jgi:PIN domain nuclease of toxin-antitoxin system
LRILLDTHAFLWWLAGDARLGVAARQAIGDDADEVYVSAASAWEITTKFRLGKWPSAALVAADVATQLDDQGFLPLPIRVACPETYPDYCRS